jgi:hypothetical protein
MKRLIALIILLLVGFYVAWPGWSAYQIATAIKAKDTATLDRKIDFLGVRATLRPAAEQTIGEIYDKFQAQSGPAASIVVGQIKKDVIPKIAETALGALVTAGNLIRVVNDGGTLKQNAEKILQEQVDKIGLPGVGGGATTQLPGGIKLPGGLGEIAGKLGIPGLGGGPAKPEVAAGREAGAAAPAGPTSAAPASYGLRNIKSFSFLGPLGFEIGVAKNAAATAPDVIAQMRFDAGDWRLTGLRPNM